MVAPLSIKTHGGPATKKSNRVILVLWICLLFAGCLKNLSSDTGAPRITREEVKTLLGQSDVVILDVRLEEEWKKSEWKIRGAGHENPEAVKDWHSKYPKEKTIIFYCS